MNREKLLEKQRDHARATARVLVDLLATVGDYDLPCKPAPGDGWDPRISEDVPDDER